MKKFIANHTGEIVMSLDDLRCVTMEPIDMSMNYGSKADDKEVARLLGDEYCLPVLATFTGSAVRFYERYLSKENAMSDLMAMTDDGGPRIARAGLCNGGAVDFDFYAQRYKAAAEVVRSKTSAAYADRRKGEIK